ncbi:hypothetical protein [Pseudaestuariivita sp.]|uniref:hypothetical protein n=1 Tax=Pseudaestuariivita sp. TaxID=2211669 RepID=UPI0040591FAF
MAAGSSTRASAPQGRAPARPQVAAFALVQPGLAGGDIVGELLRFARDDVMQSSGTLTLAPLTSHPGSPIAQTFARLRARHAQRVSFQAAHQATLWTWQWLVLNDLVPLLHEPAKDAALHEIGVDLAHFAASIPGGAPSGTDEAVVPLFAEPRAAAPTSPEAFWRADTGPRFNLGGTFDARTAPLPGKLDAFPAARAHIAATLVTAVHTAPDTYVTTRTASGRPWSPRCTPLPCGTAIDRFEALAQAVMHKEAALPAL